MANKFKPIKRAANNPVLSRKPPGSRTLGVGVSLAGAILLATLGWWIFRARETSNRDNAQDHAFSKLGATNAATDASSSGSLPERQAKQLGEQAAELAAKGKPFEAIPLYLRAIELSPKSEDFHYNIAIAYGVAGDATNAEAHYLKRYESCRTTRRPTITSAISC
jgi:tetratricopeptide (TPR) repeat protein